MKHPNEYWHEYRNGLVFPTTTTPESETDMRLAFHAGIMMAFMAVDSVLAEEPKLDSEEILTMIKWFRRHNAASALSIAATAAKDKFKTHKHE
jgi:hypothetical protein